MGFEPRTLYELMQQSTARIFRLTQGRVQTEFLIITGEPFLCPPSIVASFFNQIHFLKLVLADISTEHPTLSVACDWVPSVNGASPHVPDTIGVDLWLCVFLPNERVIRWDTVGGTVIIVVYIDS